MQRRTDLVAFAYLLLPLVLFFGGTFRPLPAAAAIAVVVIGAYPAVRSFLAKPTEAQLSGRAMAVIAVIALAWVLLGGGGHVLSTNTDWFKHDGVLNDLKRFPWPVTYETNGSGEHVILRYYMGFHIVPAFFGKVFGGLNFWTFLWEFVGVFCALTMLARRISTDRRRLLLLLMFIVFGGLDVLGYIHAYGVGMLSPNQFLDGWNIEQLNGSTVLLAWVPSHAIAAWLGMLLLLDHKEDNAFLKSLPMLLVAIGFWSIFVAVGMLPFAFMPLARRVITGRHRYLLAPAVLASLITAFVAASFLLSGAAAGNQHGFFWDIHKQPHAIDDPLLLIFFDVVPIVVALLVARAKFSTWTRIAIVLFCTFPFYVVGTYNDFTMRAIIPAQLVLFLEVIRTVDRAKSVDNAATNDNAEVAETPMQQWRWLPLGLVLLVGAGSSLTTMVRAFDPRPLRMSATATYPTDFSPFPSKLLAVVGIPFAPPDSQYLATPPSWMQNLLRSHDPAFRYTQVMTGDQPWQADASYPGSQTSVSQEPGDVIVTADNNARVHAAISKTQLPPGTYRVRGTVTLTGAPSTSNVTMEIKGQAPILLTAKDNEGEWVIDDYVSVLAGVPRPVILYVNKAPAGAKATLHDLSIDRVLNK